MNNGRIMDNLGHKWWRIMVSNEPIYLNSCNKKYNKFIPMLDEISINLLQNKIVLVSELPDTKIQNKTTRYFTYFDNYILLYEYINKISLNKRCFYEKIIGNFHQKPHFDIDIDLIEHEYIDDDVYNDIINDIIKSIDKSLMNKGIEIDIYNDILIFTSHGEHKKSCHIIIDHYCHSNNIEAKAFYDDVTKRMTQDYAIFIDCKVYSKNQDFRMVGCTKYGKNRYKIFNKEWIFCNTKIKYMGNKDGLSIFKSSLVGWIEDCKILPEYKEIKKEQYVDPLYKNTFDYIANIHVKPNNTVNKSSVIYDTDCISQDMAIEAIILFTKYYKDVLKFNIFPFRNGGIKGRLIKFTRKCPSMCPICKRVHTSDNPFLLIAKNNNVLYMCHCDPPPRSNIIIGKLFKDNSDKFISNPITLNITSNLITLNIISNPITPKITSNPIIPMIKSNPIIPTIKSNPIIPKITSNPITPKITSNPITPNITSNPITPKITSNPITPKITSNPIIPKSIDISSNKLNIYSDNITYNLNNNTKKNIIVQKYLLDNISLNIESMFKFTHYSHDTDELESMSKNKF
uniref:DNA primase n=1 Tax=Pithovirus LCPAC102 TaxID=2506587 RepID=A0A4D5XG33_9VIRU|nr:MAG: DNA primase [Pithovirus LCPAC102]